MISSSASPDSLRNKLEEIFKLMLVVWAKEGIALKTISGQKSGRLTLTVLLFCWFVYFYISEKCSKKQKYLFLEI